MNEPSKSATAEKSNSGEAKASGMVFRETIESFAVALILAFLFRAFVAEAFVIPTGSMAPTLMGAHKDISSSETGFGFQCGASGEVETETGRKTRSAVIGATCPISHFEQPLDLKNRRNHQTFSGDRILVSKFSYLFKDPKRWDVIVFKFPENARQNYIKRCVGLPSETLRIQHGDIYVRPEGELQFEIARKPPNVVEAMLQAVADSKYPSKTAIEAGIPSPWQPTPEMGKGNPGWVEKIGDANQDFSNRWTIEQTTQAWSATCAASKKDDDTAWIRYYHRVLSPMQWTAIRSTGKPPATIAPYSGRLVSDFTAYNAAIYADREDIYDQKGKLTSAFNTNWLPNDVRDRGGAAYARSMSNVPMANLETDGKHWTGDLASEFDLEIGAGKGTIQLDIVEAGVHYQCSINAANGVATLSARSGGNQLNVIDAEFGKTSDQAQGSTKLRAGKRHRLKFANVDNTLTLWVDGTTIDFLPSNRIVTDTPETLSLRRPQCNSSDPLDFAPIGLGVSGVSAKVHRAQVWRDIYYIADRSDDSLIRKSGTRNEDTTFESDLTKSITDEIFQAYCDTNYPGQSDKISKAYALARDIIFSTPSMWDECPLFANRNPVEFTLASDQFFPMGDNSPASSDARVWSNHFIPRRLLIGRAVVVFWPHCWMEPIPYTPNISRMGLIR